MKTIKKQLKRAFTIVELVIVIAVIAVLAAVLIPTFVNVLDSANESVDEQAVKNMNTALIADETLHGKPVNPSDAMEIIESAGYTVKGYVAQLSYNTIYWDSSTNRCLIYNSNEVAVTYPSDAVEKYTSVTAGNLPEYWYQLDDAYVTTLYDTTKSFSDNISALSDGETLQLTTDVELDVSTSWTNSEGEKVFSNLTATNGGSVEIDLNGNTLTDTGYVHLYNGSSLTLKNGTYVSETTGNTSTTCDFYVDESSSITLDGVTVTVSGSGIYPRGDSAQVNIINSNITSTGVYCVGTNSATVDNYGVIIHIENSTLETKASDYDSCVVMINVEGTLEITDSTIIGQRQGVMVRAGTANISNTTISCSVDTSATDFTSYIGRTDYTSDWSSGNEFAMGAVIVGNTTSDTYKANAILTMSGCTLSYDITGTNADSYSDYEIGLYLIRKNSTTYKTQVTLTDTKITGRVVNMDSSVATLTGYNGDVYYYDSEWKKVS